MRTASENVVRALARVTVNARAGSCEAVAIIAIGPDGIPDVSFGGEAELMPSINIGLDMLKQQILFHVMKPVEQTASQILRPAS
jgi:hypothetical protein